MRAFAAYTLLAVRVALAGLVTLAGERASDLRVAGAAGGRLPGPGRPSTPSSWLWPCSARRPADRIPASGPDTGPHEVIHLGGQAAVVVPVSDFLRLQALEQAASAQELEDAEDTAALADWRARQAAGQTSYVPHDEALRRLGLAG